MSRLSTAALRYSLACVALAVLIPAINPLAAQKRHQYSWSEWTTLNDGKSNGIQFSFRKGDNDFIERGMIFVRFYNRYRQSVNGEVSFDIVNTSTGQVKTANEGFDLKAETLGEDEGSWDTVPGDNENPQRWAALGISLRNIRVKRLLLEDGAVETARTSSRQR